MSKQRARTTELGAAMVEFAIVSMLFFTLVIGLVDFGLGIFYYNMLSNAAREGARFGVIDSRTPDQICYYALSKTFVPDVTSPLPACAGGTVTIGRLSITANDGTRRVLVKNAAGVTVEQTPSTPVVVTLTYNYQPVTPLVQALVGTTKTLTAESSMYIED